MAITLPHIQFWMGGGEGEGGADGQKLQSDWNVMNERMILQTAWSRDWQVLNERIVHQMLTDEVWPWWSSRRRVPFRRRTNERPKWRVGRPTISLHFVQFDAHEIIVESWTVNDSFTNSSIHSVAKRREKKKMNKQTAAAIIFSRCFVRGSAEEALIRRLLIDSNIENSRDDALDYYWLLPSSR